MGAEEKEFYVSNIKLLDTYVKWFDDIKLAEKNDKEEPDIPFFIVDSIMRISKRLSFKDSFIQYTFRDDMIADAQYDCIRYIKKFNPVVVGEITEYKVEIEVHPTHNIQKSLKITKKHGGNKNEGHIKYFSIKEKEHKLYGKIFAVRRCVSNKHDNFPVIVMGVNDNKNENDILEFSKMLKTVKTNSLITYSENPFAYITTISYQAFLRRIDAEKKQKYIKSKIVMEVPIEDFMDTQQHEDDKKFANQYIDFLRETANSDDSVPMSIRRGKKKQNQKEPEGMNLESLSD